MKEKSLSGQMELSAFIRGFKRLGYFAGSEPLFPRVVSTTGTS